MTTSSKRRVTDEDLGLEDHKKSRVEGGQDEVEQEPEEPEDLRGIFKAEGVDIEFDFNKSKKEGDKDDNEDEEIDNFYIGKTHNISFLLLIKYFNWFTLSYVYA